MAECARVLRPGGRLCVSDLTVEQDALPPEIFTQPAAWAGCVAGALAEADFERKLERDGPERSNWRGYFGSQLPRFTAPIVVL